jgi:hypothetical protein
MLDATTPVKQNLIEPPRMPRLRLLLPLALSLGALRCDGTLTGIGREPRPPETKLPPAPVETVSARAPAMSDGGAPEEETIIAQHLLVMYEGSKSAPKNIKRTREEARARAFEALARIKGGQPFDAVVAAYTDEPGGAQRKGELGRFSRDMMVKPFSDAAFALDVGQVSTVIESPFGFHVIRRIE